MRAISSETRGRVPRALIVGLLVVLGAGSPASAEDAAAPAVDQNNVRLDQADLYPGVGSDATPREVRVPEVFVFPATGDTRFNQSGTNFWNQGDFVEGSRTFTVSTVEMSMVLQISPNVLTCDTQDHAFMVDGVTIGTFSVTAGATQVTATFNFAQVDPGPHTLRIETTRTVNGGCGSAGFPDDVSTVDFVEVPVELMSLTVE